MCIRLGVSVLRQHLLEENSDVVELSEAFGQSEALTVRLKHITGILSYMKHTNIQSPFRGAWSHDLVDRGSVRKIQIYSTCNGLGNYGRGCLRWGCLLVKKMTMCLLRLKDCISDALFAFPGFLNGLKSAFPGTAPWSKSHYQCLWWIWKSMTKRASASQFMLCTD